LAATSPEAGTNVGSAGLGSRRATFWWPATALAIGVTGLLLFAGVLFGAIPTLTHPASPPPRTDFVLTGISVTYGYTNISEIFGADVPNACPECPLQFESGSVVGIAFPQFNTSGASRMVLADVTMTATAPVFQSDGAQNSTMHYVAEMGPDQLVYGGLTFYAPNEPGTSFTVTAIILVSYCGPPECAAG
jgi:hypothetical protein